MDPSSLGKGGGLARLVAHYSFLIRRKMIHIITKSKEQPPSEEFKFFSYESDDVRFDIYLQLFTQNIFTKIGIQAWLWWDESEEPARISRNIEFDPSRYLRDEVTIEESLAMQMLPLINAMWRDLYYELPARYRPRAIPKFLWEIG